MSIWKVSDITNNELNRVDQEKFANELFVLRHSPAARQIFAKAQNYLTVDIDGLFFSEARELFGAIDNIAIKVAHRHPWAYHYLNPNRKWVPGAGKFWQLADALGYETKPDEYGDETLIHTIFGWQQI